MDPVTLAMLTSSAVTVALEAGRGTSRRSGE